MVKEIKLIALFSNIEINQSNREQIKNLAVQNLVERTIKRNEIERLKVTRYSKQDLDQQISNIAIKSGHKIGTVEPLFSKIEESVISEQKSKLGSS